MRSKCREALVQLIAELRPSWGSEGIRAAIEDPKLAMSHEGKVALVFVKAALDGRIRTPGGVLQPGAHWDEPGAPTPLPKYVDPFNRPAVSDEAREETYRRGAALAKTALLAAKTNTEDCGRNG